MGITPTSLIATHGLINGQGLQVNPKMTDLFDVFNTNPLITSFSGLSANPNVGNVSGLSETLASLPSFFTQGPSTIANVSAHAADLLPPGGISQFLGIHSTASSFVNTNGDWSAALNSFAGDGGGGGGFGDFGIGISDALGALSGGVTSMLGGFDLGSITSQLSGSLSGLVDQASKLGLESFSSITNNVTGALTGLANEATSSISALTTGLTSELGGITTGITSSLTGSLPSSLTNVTDKLGNAGADILQNSLKTVGASLPNFGTAFKFTDLATLGPTNLINSLQSQGLGQISGLNKALASVGVDPTNITGAPTQLLNSALSYVGGDDLKKVVSATGLKLQNEITDLSQVLNVKNILPPTAITAMGLPKDITAGLPELGNKLTNLGIQADNLSLGNYLSTVEVGNFPHLNSLKDVIPPDIAAGLSSAISAGNGSGLFGNPTLIDMMGSAAGVTHVDAFTTINSLANTMASSSTGQSISTNMNILNNLLALGYDESNPSVAAAYANLQASVNTFNTNYAGQSHLINLNLNDSQAQMDKELQNIALSGQSLGDVTPASTQEILGFGQSLHDYGVDYQNMGYNTILSNCATDDLTGDAIKASLMEGRNLARSSLVNKATPTLPDTQTLLTQSLPYIIDPTTITWDSGNIDSMTETYSTITTALGQVQNYTQNPGNTPADLSQVAGIQKDLMQLRNQLNADQVAYYNS